jgi:Tol biopolymer transport system component
MDKNVSDPAARPEATGEPVLESTLETIGVASRDRRVVHRARAHFEAPNWSRDGRELLFNEGGRLFRLPVEGGTPRVVDTGFATRLNNDHGLSPDGAWLAVSDKSQDDGKSAIYVLPSEGGTPRRVTAKAPSYWHGWSPDGRTLAYCAARDGALDVYTIPVEGGEETRLTTAPGIDDGPDYSPDGEWIYFNSERTGTMQIWRMRPDGREQGQVTSDGHADWFPHPSPDGKWVVFLSYDAQVKGHPPNEDVQLRVMPAGGGEVEMLARLFGGQGTINVPSWSPDGARLAFVSYRLVQP